jgi:hypothetical protein
MQKLTSTNIMILCNVCKANCFYSGFIGMIIPDTAGNQIIHVSAIHRY